jgi:two-component system, LytTR family, sensor kinase
MMSRNTKLLIHCSAWITYLLIILLGSSKYDMGFLTSTISGMIPVIGIFYLNVYLLLPRFLPQRNVVLLIGSLIILNFVAVLLRSLLVAIVQPELHTKGMFDPVMFWNQFRVNVLFIGISFAYWYAQRNYKIEKDQQRLEKEVLDGRLAVLKNQINPHFLHNTLGFLYTKSLAYSADLSDAIFRLSEMMRYSLGENTEDGKVPLSREITHLQHFIRIHQLRFENKLQVNFNVKGDSAGFKIMPLLLITFVENAFKHGDLSDARHPVKINVETNRNHFYFTSANKKYRGVKERSSGIGLQNIKRRLELAYPGQYELRINDTIDEFEVILKLMPVNDKMYRN